MNSDDLYLPLRELVTYSGMSLRSLRRAIYDPVCPLPHYRPGGRKILVRRSEFDRWIQQSRQSHTPVDLDHLIEEIMREIRP